MSIKGIVYRILKFNTINFWSVFFFFFFSYTIQIKILNNCSQEFELKSSFLRQSFYSTHKPYLSTQILWITFRIRVTCLETCHYQYCAPMLLKNLCIINLKEKNYMVMFVNGPLILNFSKIFAMLCKWYSNISVEISSHKSVFLLFQVFSVLLWV